MTSALFTELTRKVLHPSIVWADVQAGDTIEVMIFGRWGYEREHRAVVAVDWPTIRLAEGDREYDVDVTKPDSIKRDMRLVHRPTNSQPGSGAT